MVLLPDDGVLRAWIMACSSIKRASVLNDPIRGDIILESPVPASCTAGTDEEEPDSFGSSVESLWTESDEWSKRRVQMSTRTLMNETRLE